MFIAPPDMAAVALLAGGSATAGKTFPLNLREP